MTLNNDPFAKKVSPFAPPKPPEVIKPEPTLPLPSRQGKIPLPPIPGKPSNNLPPLPGLPVVNTPEVDEENEAIYEILFDEKLPATLYDDLTEEEDKKIELLFESAVTPATEQTLYALANNEDWVIRSSVAENSHAPESLLTFLSKDEDSYVRQSVLENPNTNIDVYTRFVDDVDVMLVRAFIEFERTTPEMLKELYDTDEIAIAYGLIDSDKVSPIVKTSIQKRLSL